jgi:hypothetical protein
MKVPFEFDLDWYGAFDILLKELHMEWINNDDDFEIKNGKVYANGKVVDDRADLFAALRNVQNAQIPNLEFRSDPYITHYGDEADE